MKKRSSEIVIAKEFNKVEKEILYNLSEILGVTIEPIINSLTSFLIGQPLFHLPIMSILNTFIKGYASFRDFREFEMIVSFIDSAQNKSNIEKGKFAGKIEDDPELIKKIIYYVSQQNDVFKSKLLGNLFKEYQNDKLNKEEFISILLIINKIDWFIILEFANLTDNILTNDDHFDFFYSSEKNESWECLNLKWSSLNSDHFGKSKDKFLSAGLINQNIIVQPIPGVLGNYSEQEQVKRLREASNNVHVYLNFTYEGCLIVRFGDIKNIDENYSFG